MPVVEEICAADSLHVTLKSISDELERRGVPTARGGQWHPATVRDLLKRAGKSLPDVRRRSPDIVTPLQDRVFSHERDRVGLSPQSIGDNLVLQELKQKLPELFVLKHQGWSYRKLSREYGYDRFALVREFKKQRKIWAKMSPQAKREAVIALANAGMSRQGIIEELHVSQRTLYRYLPPQSSVHLYEDRQAELGATENIILNDFPMEEEVCHKIEMPLLAMDGNATMKCLKRQSNTSADRRGSQLCLALDPPDRDAGNDRTD